MGRVQIAAEQVVAAGKDQNDEKGDDDDNNDNDEDADKEDRELKIMRATRTWQDRCLAPMQICEAGRVSLHRACRSQVDTEYCPSEARWMVNCLTCKPSKNADFMEQARAAIVNLYEHRFCTQEQSIEMVNKLIDWAEEQDREAYIKSGEEYLSERCRYGPPAECICCNPHDQCRDCLIVLGASRTCLNPFCSNVDPPHPYGSLNEDNTIKSNAAPLQDGDCIVSCRGYDRTRYCGDYIPGFLRWIGGICTSLDECVQSPVVSKLDYDNPEDALKINLLEKISKSKEKRRKAKVDKFVHEKVPGDTKLYPIKVKSERSTDGISVIRDDEAMDCFDYYAFCGCCVAVQDDCYDAVVPHCP